jgi:hypothetical protein
MLDTKPTGKRTGYSHSKCYASALEDCSKEITREHYISKKLLDRLGDFEAHGLAWLKGNKMSLPETAFRSHILCKRHNVALSPLDDNITQLYDLMRRWQDRKVVGDLVLDGEDLERWAIKVMFGLLASGSAEMLGEDGRPAPRLINMPRKPMRVLFCEAALPKRAGYHHGHSVFGHLKPTAVRTRLDYTPGSKVPDSIVFSVVGFTWITTLTKDAPMPAPGPGSEPYVYRPSDFTIGDTGHLTLRWNGARRRLPGNVVVRLFERKEG